MWLSVAIVFAAIIALILKYIFTTPGPNPFARDCREPLREIVPRKEKNKVLKQGFVASKVPENLDAVVIAAASAGSGYPLHWRPAGAQAFPLHADQMTNGQLQWSRWIIRMTGWCWTPRKPQTYPIYSGRTRFPEELKKCFPGEEKAIDEYIRLSKKAGRGIWLLALLKLVPTPIAKFLVYTGLCRRLSFFFEMADRSLTEVVNGLTQNKDLRAVFTYIFGTYGNMPKDASFSMHSLLVTHYLNGAWYPRGGATEIAYHMIPIIEKAGGAVLVRAPVNRILFNSENEAIGVSVMKGQEEVHIRAPMVISDAGIFNTYQKLLPKELQAMPAIQKQLSLMKNGEGGLSVFVGLDGSKEELGLKADNYWIFKENNFDELVTDYMNGDREESAKNVPILFVASPSAKDPVWQQHNPGKSTVSLVSFANYEWFEEWKDGKVTNRSPEYKELKQTFIDSILEVVMDVFPKITRDKIEYVDAGTPITNTHYIGAPKGEIYGADHGRERFSPELNSTIRPQTPLKNLYLTGQDVFLCGFAGALAGALTCGSVLLKRNLHLDTIALAKRTKYFKQKGE
ncbi:hypothetical protein WMY93_018701 [Mugilogobius chulae]|uniref:All-trans-retinol 13,14-reductase n=1 Tax=Mugilogobius chulae TaxID=88201 RepID=A0AAW0NPJ4_9GOBI